MYAVQQGAVHGNAHFRQHGGTFQFHLLFRQAGFEFEQPDFRASFGGGQGVREEKRLLGVFAFDVKGGEDGQSHHLAQIHPGQADTVGGLLHLEPGVTHFNLHLQQVIVAHHSVALGAFHVVGKPDKQGIVAGGHFLQRLGLCQKQIGFVYRHNGFFPRELFSQFRHLDAYLAHFVAGYDFSSHVQGLCQVQVAHEHRPKPEVYQRVQG